MHRLAMKSWPSPGPVSKNRTPNQQAPTRDLWVRKQLNSNVLLKENRFPPFRQQKLAPYKWRGSWPIHDVWGMTRLRELTSTLGLLEPYKCRQQQCVFDTTDRCPRLLPFFPKQPARLDAWPICLAGGQAPVLWPPSTSIPLCLLWL